MIVKHQDGFLPILAIFLIVTLGLFSVALCVAAEFNRAKWKDLKVAGRLCYAPKSRAFGFGIAASVCWSVAQIIGKLMVCRNWKCKARKPMILTFLLFVSWTSFVIGMILLGSATSMNKKQEYGKGWLDVECYIVKDGVFIGSAILALISVAATLAYAKSSKSERTQVDQESTVHQQLDPNSF